MFAYLAAAALAAGALALACSSPSLKEGTLVPDFELLGSDGHTYRLSDFRGRSAVALVWFPKAFTGYCTQECKKLSQIGAALEEFQVQLFALSCDSAATNRRFAEHLGLPYPVLSDPWRQVARRLGVLKGIPYPARHTLYVGKDGRLLKLDRSVNVTRAGEDLLQNLRSLNIETRPS